MNRKLLNRLLLITFCSIAVIGTAGVFIYFSIERCPESKPHKEVVVIETSEELNGANPDELQEALSHPIHLTPRKARMIRQSGCFVGSQRMQILDLFGQPKWEKERSLSYAAGTEYSILFGPNKHMIHFVIKDGIVVDVQISDQ